MSLRLNQTAERRVYDVLDYTFKRGTGAISTTGNLFAFKSGLITFVVGHFTVVGAVPGSGLYTIYIPSLTQPDAQYFGRVAQGTVIGDVNYTLGVLNFLGTPAFATGQVVSVNGAVT